MPNESAEPNDFVASWLVEAKTDATLNQDMVSLLADHHGKGTSTDDDILMSVLKLTSKPEASDEIH